MNDPLVGIDFWSVHSVFFLIAMLFFPRLTLLFLTAWGGGWWWVGLIFAPRFMAAILATVYYWHTNPALVVICWLGAIMGNSSSYEASNKIYRRRH